MKKSEINRRLNRALNQMTPDLAESIASAPVTPMDRHDSFTRQEPVRKKGRSAVRWASAAACACLFLAVGLFACWYQLWSADSFIDLDINPSIEITTNRQNRVLSARALNADAEAVLSGMDLKNVHIDTAVNAILGSMLKNGYLTADRNTILLSVQNGDPQKAAQLQEQLTLQIGSTLEQSNVSPRLVRQTLPHDFDDDDFEDLAEELGISTGKLALIYRMQQADPTLSLDALSACSVEELMRLAQSAGIDLHDFLDYDDLDFDDDEEDEEPEDDEDDDDEEEDGTPSSGVSSSKNDRDDDEDEEDKDDKDDKDEDEEDEDEDDEDEDD